MIRDAFEIEGQKNARHDAAALDLARASQNLLLDLLLISP
ncbi:MAG: hypothetical protein ACJAZW_001820 [Maritalea sp.]|jgi:hypothetical protein